MGRGLEEYPEWERLMRDAEQRHVMPVAGCGLTMWR